MQLLRALRVGLDGASVDAVRIGVDAGAGLEHVHHDQADDQRQASQELEINQRLEANAADLFHVAHLGDTSHHGREDDRRDHHADQLDERIAERLHLLGQIGVGEAEHDADEDGGQHLHVQVRVDRFAVGQRGSHGCGLPPP